LLEECFEIITAPDPSQETLKNLCIDVEGIILRTTSRLSAGIIQSAQNLKVISRTGAGVDNVDVEVASQRGIKICNLPGLNSISVSEHAAALILSLAKALPYLDEGVRSGNWTTRNSRKGIELRGKVLGVIGYGRIGSRTAAILREGFGMRVLAYDPYLAEGRDSGDVSPSEEQEVVFVGLDELLTHADVVTLHLPATPETEGLLSRERLQRMKPTAYLINTSRGSVVEEEALVEMLKSRKIAGAGLDVFEREPLSSNHPLAKMSNVILTPHAAALTRECSIRAAVEAARAVVDVLSGREPQHVANRAELERMGYV